MPTMCCPCRQSSFSLLRAGRGSCGPRSTRSRRCPQSPSAGAFRESMLRGCICRPCRAAGRFLWGASEAPSFCLARPRVRPDAPLSLVANVLVTNPRVEHTTLRSVRGRIAWIPGTDLIVRRAVAQDGHGGSATVSGHVPTTPRAAWNLAVNASGANLASLLSPLCQAADQWTGVCAGACLRAACCADSDRRHAGL